MESHIRTQFLGLSTHDKELVLAQLIHELTISVRVYLYVDASKEEINVEKLKTINQLIHHASSKIRGLVSGTPKQYPDDVFINIMIETGELGFEREFEWLWDQCFGRLRVAERN